MNKAQLQEQIGELEDQVLDAFAEGIRRALEGGLKYENRDGVQREVAIGGTGPHAFWVRDADGLMFVGMNAADADKLFTELVCNLTDQHVVGKIVTVGSSTRQ